MTGRTITPSQRAILLTLVLGAASGAALLFGRPQTGSAGAQESHVEVLVARRPLLLGTLLRDPELLFERRRYVKGREPAQALRDYDRLRARRLMRPVAAGQWVTADDLWGDGYICYLPFPSNRQRAFLLQVPCEAVQGGCVRPRCRVDVAWAPQGVGRPPEKTLLHQVEVLTVDADGTGSPRSGEALPSLRVVLGVTPVQAEMLSLATEHGTLNLVVLPAAADAP
jgi:Flp pilus assembly protein CpaB